MPKVKVKLENVCATDAAGHAPFIESLRAVRKLALPAKTFYWLNKISQVIEAEFADYEAARIALVMKLGVKTETGYQVPPEKQEEFAREMATLNGELELPIEDTAKLALPTTGVADDWFLLMREMDIFAEPN